MDSGDKRKSETGIHDQASLDSTSIRDYMPSFDEMAMLAKTDPAAFEMMRTELCEQAIARAPLHMRRRLQGLQFKIDMERKRSGSSMGACIRISQLMNESLLKLNAALSNPRAYLEHYYSQSAEVIGLYVGQSKA